MKRCTLCGSKLDHTKRCTFCGLDNTKNDDSYGKMINRSQCDGEPMTHVHEEIKKPSAKKVENVPTYKTVPQGNSVYKTVPQRNNSSMKKPAGCLPKLLGFIPIIIAIIGIISSFLSDFGNRYEEVWIDEEVIMDDWIEYDEEGYFFQEELEPGIYEVGYHIPAGVYEIQGYEGYEGFVELHDSSLDRYFSEIVSDITTIDDYELSDGAYVVVREGAKVTVTTENAQPYAFEPLPNYLSEVVSVDQYDVGYLFAGEDFEAGVYNVVFEPHGGDYAYGNVQVFCEDIESDYEIFGFEIYFDSEMNSNCFYNLPIPEGAKIFTYIEGEGELFLIPSDLDTYMDYNDFYWNYLY